VYNVQEAEPALVALGIHLRDPIDAAQDDCQAIEPLNPNTSKELCHKVLICFGDLARYRELYNEAAAARRGRGRGARKTVKGDESHKERNWARAGECYQQARLLLPENGLSFLTSQTMYQLLKQVVSQETPPTSSQSWHSISTILFLQSTGTIVLYALSDRLKLLKQIWSSPSNAP
jgi:hypothetical protein